MQAPERLVLALLLGALLLGATGCIYALHAPFPPSQEHIRIMANQPAEYVVRVETKESKELPVPADGRVTASFPGFRPTCSVYMLGIIKVGGGRFPQWQVSVSHGGNTVRTLSLKKVKELPVDEAGYHLLKLPK
jgi:hypothetical protein